MRQYLIALVLGLLVAATVGVDAVALRQAIQPACRITLNGPRVIRQPDPNSPFGYFGLVWLSVAQYQSSRGCGGAITSVFSQFTAPVKAPPRCFRVMTGYIRLGVMHTCATFNLAQPYSAVSA